MITKIRILYEQICRFLYYGWHLRNANEFDSYSILQAEKAAADRLVKLMKSDKTHLVWNSSKQTNLMKKLLEYHELVGRAYKDNYTKNYAKFNLFHSLI